MYFKIKKFKTSKAILLKIFVLQQKNRLSFNIRLDFNNVVLLTFLWKHGYILGFTCLKSNIYTIFLKKQYKQFSVNFFEKKLQAQDLKSVNKSSSVETPIIYYTKGLKLNPLNHHNFGGFLLCSII